MSTLVQIFTERARAAQAEVIPCSDAVAATDRLVALLGELGFGSVPGPTAVAVPGRLFSPALAASVAGRCRGFSTAVRTETAVRATVGVSEADWAVAETGSLAQDVSAVAKRLVATLPEVHVAFLDAQRVLPDLAALFSLAATAAGYFALTTGPSRTADIERVLTIGAHGPRRLLVLLVGGQGPAG